MSRFEKFALALLIIVALGLWAVVGMNFYRDKWQAPLGPGLALPSLTAPLDPTSTIFLARSPTGPTNTLLPGQPTLTPYTSVSENTPLCGGPITMSILAVGSDTRATGYLYGLADVIRLVRVDFVNGRVSILEVPRDLWVQIPEIADHYNISQGKLNQAYLYVNK